MEQKQLKATTLTTYKSLSRQEKKRSLLTDCLVKSKALERPEAKDLFYTAVANIRANLQDLGDGDDAQLDIYSIKTDLSALLISYSKTVMDDPHFTNPREKIEVLSRMYKGKNNKKNATRDIGRSIRLMEKIAASTMRGRDDISINTSIGLDIFMFMRCMLIDADDLEPFILPYSAREIIELILNDIRPDNSQYHRYPIEQSGQ